MSSTAGSERGRRLRILLAEDELLVAMDIEATLRELGCEVVGPVATVSEVERIVATTELDGAVLDVNLRGVQIFSALPGLLQRGLPVVLSSGYEESMLLSAEFGHLPMLVKPYQASQLVAAIETLLGPRERA